MQYLVYAIRREYKQSGRQIAVFGISQGGLLARFALTFWPDLRSKVSDVLGAAGTMHGNRLIRCSAKRPCAPAVWQQKAGSHLIAALDARSLRAPGPTSWTTVRSSTDEVVQPQTGQHPESALAGASNILIQRVCPGRKVSHTGTALDSVTFAAFVDAISHQGAAKVSRFPKNVCSHPYAPGLDPITTASSGDSETSPWAPIAAAEMPRLPGRPPRRRRGARRGKVLQTMRPQWLAENRRADQRRARNARNPAMAARAAAAESSKVAKNASPSVPSTKPPSAAIAPPTSA